METFTIQNFFLQEIWNKKEKKASTKLSQITGRCVKSGASWQ